MLDVIVSGIGAVAVLVAAVFWFWASKVEVPNNIDTFIDVLKKISRLNANAALTAMVGAICALVLFLNSIIGST